MLDKKSIIVVVILGILVIFWIPIMTWQGFIKPPQRQVAPVQTTQTTPADTLTHVEATPTVTPQTPPRPMPPRDSTAMANIGLTEPFGGVPEDTLIIETEVMQVVMTNHGGGPNAIRLKKFLYADNGPVEMLPSKEIVAPEFSFQNGTFRDNRLAFTANLSPREYKVGTEPLDVIYTHTTDNGGSIVKRYRFYPDRYDYDLILEVQNRAAFGFERGYRMEWNSALAPTEPDINDDFSSFWGMAMQGTERVKYDDYDDNRFNVSQDGVTRWIATRSKFFTAILIPRSRPADGALASGNKIQRAFGEKTFQARDLTIGLEFELPSEQNLVDSFTVFVGPMDYDLLKSFNNEVADIMDIGTTPYVGWLIKIFAIPIMWLLPRMYDYLPNYGIVIILFALIIKVLTYPLTKKTVRSMLAMKEVQPKMEELRKKHKNNPQALNREMMKLYKDAGINPLSGCLPYLPQLPLFFALFAVFRSTILLRQAPFVFWWDDLSRGAQAVTDPYIILVVLMAGLMFVQQKMTMTDPKNKFLVYLMPVMFGFFFYKASAGLVLYWTCFSLFSLIEQVMSKKPSAPDTSVVEVK